MADNAISVDANNIATDDIGGNHFQRIKLIHGADGTNDGDVSTANPLPVEQQGTVTMSGTVSGTVGISGVATSGAAAAVKRFNVLATADGDEIIAAPTGTKVIQVRSLAIIAMSTTAAEVYFQTATTGTDTLGNSTNGFQIALDADGDNVSGFVLPYNPDGWLQTADSDEALEIKMSSNQPMLVMGTYVEV